MKLFLSLQPGVPGKMDGRYSNNIDIFPCIQTCGDQRFTPDVLDPIYASSPNSLFMYDQEKIDMQCSTISDMHSLTCPKSSSMAQLSDDFDLKAQYEISQDLSLSSLTSGETTMPASSTMISDSGGGGWSDKGKDSTKDIMISRTRADDGPDPTLAELNLTSSNLDLLDDINSYINSDVSSFYLDSRTDQSFGKEEPCYTKMVKDEPSYTKMTDFILTPVKNTDIAKQSSLNQFTVPSLIKTESDVYEPSCQKTYTTLYKSASSMETNTSSLQLLSHLYAQQQSSMENQSTSTLQKLLQRKPQHLPVTSTQVKVEEPLKSPCDVRTRNPSGGRTRKRSSTQAGLETMDAKWEEIKQFIYNPSQTDMQQNLQPQIKKERQRYGKPFCFVFLTHLSLTVMSHHCT